MKGKCASYERANSRKPLSQHILYDLSSSSQPHLHYSHCIILHTASTHNLLDTCKKQRKAQQYKSASRMWPSPPETKNPQNRIHRLQSGPPLKANHLKTLLWSNSNRKCSIIKCIVIIAMLSSLGNVNARKPKEPNYGRFIDNLKNYAHAIKGSVYAVDESTIFIKSFAYDGLGPDAYFWVGKSMNPSPQGYIIPYPEDYVGGEPPKLRAHNGTDIILRLPMGRRIRDIRWLAVWCRRFTVDFADVMIPASIDVAKPRVLPEFRRLAHGLRSSNISILDAKTFYIPNLHYDGAGPDAYFWVGTGSEPNIMGTKVPNEIGSLEPLRGYQGEDIEIQLPGNLTVYDIDWLAVWCVEYRHNFGHVYIPDNLDVPPALGQTQISTTTAAPMVRNCRELLPNRLQIKWEVQGEYLHVELIGRIGERDYMAFGISGASGRPQMVQSDVVVAFYDMKERKFRAVDYYVSSLAQCDGKEGVCPDDRIGGREDVSAVSGDRKNGVTSIKYRRPLQTNDVHDKAVLTDRNVSVIVAIGPLNSKTEANAHSKDGYSVNVEDIKINFSATNDQACPASLYDHHDDVNAPKPWPTRQLSGATYIQARIGPTGGLRGYSAITKHPSWGIAWYLNDLLIPELYVERGQTYTFEVEGGDRPENPAQYHPLYITDSAEGGYAQKTDDEKELETVYAGIVRDSGDWEVPSGLGRYCEWKHKTVDKSASIETFTEYMKTLHLECEDGEPGYMNWTVPMDAPDLLYYQCYTHRNLGWRINVVDAGHTSFQNHGAAAVHRAPTTMQLMTTATILLLVSIYFPIVAMHTDIA